MPAGTLTPIDERIFRIWSTTTPIARRWSLLTWVWCFVTTVLIAQTAPVFTAAPTPRQVVNLGRSLTLGVAASGSPAPSYQWSRNGLPIPGATSANHTIDSATARDCGWYRVSATNANGTATSAVIFVNVAVPAPQILDLPISGGTGRPAAPPSDLTDVTAVAAGSLHALALKSDGTVVGWGSNGQGESVVPAGLSDAVAIAASANQSLALTADGRVVAWGSDDNGQARVPPGLDNVVAVAAGGEHCLALTSDGRVIAWGSGSFGQTTVPTGLTNVIAVAAGLSASLALKADGTVTSWGGGSEGSVPTGLSDVVAVAAGFTYGLALKGDGTVVDWMRTGGLQSYSKIGGPPQNLTNVVAISSAWNQSVAVRADGTAAAWETEFEVGGGPMVSPPGIGFGEPTLPQDVGQVVAVAAGRDHIVVLRDSSKDALPAIAVPPANQIANVGGRATFSVSASGIPAPTYQGSRNGSPIFGATSASLALAEVQDTSAGTYSVTITNAVGRVISTAATLTVLMPPAITASSPARQVVNLGRNLTLSVAATSSDTPRFQWKRNGVPIAGATAASCTIDNATTRDGGWYQAVVTNSIGTTTSAVMFVNVAVNPARVVVWGDPDPRNTSVPAGLTDVVAVAAGYLESFALRADGTVTAWGGGTLPGGLTDVVAIAAGSRHNVALKSDGTVVAWGLSTPVVPAGLRDVVSIDVNGTTAFAVRADGSVVTWGNTSVGILPRSLVNVVRLAAGSSSGLALKSDGTLAAWEWVFPSFWNLGTVPPGATGIVAVAAGSGHNLALTSAGTVLAWGNNSRGQTVVPAGLANVAGIAGAADYSLALKSDGTVAAWGYGPSGQTNVPAGLGRVATFSAGVFHCIVVVDASPDTAPVIIGQPASQTIAPGGVATFSVSTAGTGTGSAYQWLCNGSPIAGATAATLTLSDTQAGGAGRYAVRVTNALGTAISNSATLIIDPALNPGRLVNLSVRSNAGSGPQTLIVGVVIGGASSSVAASVLIRGVGPSLAPFGVSGFLADPLLRIYSGDTVVTSNDNWSGDAQVARTGANVGAFALGPASSRDAAIATQLGAGSYTSQINGADGGVGITLAEVYDAAAADAFTASAPRLLNVSTRTQVGTGSGTLITGFVIGGATSKTVLVRAIGPTLANFGVPDALPDPKLDLFAGSTLVNTNDNWGGSAAIATAGARVGAFALNADSKDAVLLVTLPPGGYSAQVTGVGGASGVVLVEIYDVP